MSDLDLNQAKLKEFMRLKPTKADTAAFFECSEKTVERYIKEHFNLTFREFRERYMVHTRMQVVRKAIELATKGNVPMLIFCLKNLCGWMDRPNQDDAAKPPVSPQAPIVLSDEQLKQLVKAARGLKAV